MLLRARADRDRARPRAAADRRGRARRRPPVGEAALGLARARARRRGSSTTRSRASRPRCGISSASTTACRSTACSAAASATRCGCTPTATPARRCTRWTRRWSSGRRAGAQEPPEAVATGAIRNPEHGRAYAKGVPDEVFTPELYAERAQQVVADLGFSALKFDLDVPTPYQQDTASGTLSRAEIRYMVGLAAAVIDAVGDEVDVAFDCHWRYQVSDASAARARARAARADVARGPGAAGERRRRCARVTKSTSTPIATGENGYMRHGFREAFECGRDRHRRARPAEDRRPARDAPDRRLRRHALHLDGAALHRVADRDDRQRPRRAPRSRTSSRSSGTA